MTRPLAVRSVRALVAGAAALGLLGVAGCGGAGQDSVPATSTGPTSTGPSLPPAAEPGNAPEPKRTPAGKIVDLGGGAPWGIAADADSGVVAVALRSPGRLALVNMRSRQVRVVPVPGAARMLDVASPGGPLLLPAEHRNMLYDLDLPTGTVTAKTPTGKQPHEAVRVGDTTFVADEFGHQVSVLRDGKTIDELQQPIQPGGITATGGRVAVIDVRGNMMHVYDVGSRKQIAALPAGEGPSHVKPIGEGKVAVSDVRGNAVLTFDLTGEPHRLDRMKVPGRAFGLATDPGRDRVYAALANTNAVAQLRVAEDGTLGQLRTVPTVRQPNSLAVNRETGTVYVAGNADGQLQIVRSETFDGS